MLFRLAGLFALVVAVVTGFLVGAQGISLLWILPLGFLGGFVAAVLAELLFLFYQLQKVDMSVPREHDDPKFRKIVGVYAHAFCTLLRMRFHVTGLEKKPKEGRFLVVSNHLHEMDIPSLYFPFEDCQLSFVSKQENRDMFVVGKVMHQLACPLLNRENDREALKTILKCVQLLKDDELSLVVFPEGYTSRDGRLQPLRAGSLKIATKAKVPIVVCTLQNTDKVMGNIKRLKPTDIYVHIVDVITPEQQQGKTAVALAEEIHQMMLDDLGPDFAPLNAGE